MNQRECRAEPGIRGEEAKSLKATLCANPVPDRRVGAKGKFIPPPIRIKRLDRAKEWITLEELLTWLRGQALPRLSVCGRPGMGATTLVGQIAVRFARQEQQDDFLPAYIPRNIWSRWSTLGDLARYFHELPGVTSASEKGLLEIIRERRDLFLFILDGVDAASAERMSDLLSQATALEGFSVIVSGHEDALSKVDVRSLDRKVVLAPWGSAEIQKYVETRRAGDYRVFKNEVERHSKLLGNPAILNRYYEIWSLCHTTPTEGTGETVKDAYDEFMVSALVRKDAGTQVLRALVTTLGPDEIEEATRHAWRQAFAEGIKKRRGIGN
jgi:hypothetical protein